jgi:osmotically-inducible protein OsmY
MDGFRIMFDTTLNPAFLEADCDFTVNDSVVNSAVQAPVGSASIYADQRLAQEASRALREAGLPALRDLEIEVTRGVVILWGRVPTYHQKQLAQATVQKLDGVRGIANGVEVVCVPSRRAGR